VLWRNLRLRLWERRLRQALVAGAFWLLVLFYVVPVSAVQVRRRGWWLDIQSAPQPWPPPCHHPLMRSQQLPVQRRLHRPAAAQVQCRCHYCRCC
jgi:hypothetical protein